MAGQFHRGSELSDSRRPVEQKGGGKAIFIQGSRKRLERPGVSQKAAEALRRAHSNFKEGKVFFRTVRTRPCTWSTGPAASTTRIR